MSVKIVNHGLSVILGPYSSLLVNFRLYTHFHSKALLDANDSLHFSFFIIASSAFVNFHSLKAFVLSADFSDAISLSLSLDGLLGGNRSSCLFPCLVLLNHALC